MPFEDDKPKDTENPMFEASSVLVAEAIGIKKAEIRFVGFLPMISSLM